MTDDAVAISITIKMEDVVMEIQEKVPIDAVEESIHSLTTELGHSLNAVIVNREAKRLHDQNPDWNDSQALSTAARTVGPYLSLDNAAIRDDLGNWVTGTHPDGVFERTQRGYKSGGPPDMYHGPVYWDDWNSNVNNTARNEDFADMYVNWVFDTFDYSQTANGAGTARRDWMTSNMLQWISQATN